MGFDADAVPLAAAPGTNGWVAWPEQTWDPVGRVISVRANASEGMAFGLVNTAIVVGVGLDWTLTQYFVWYYLQHGMKFRPQDYAAGNLHDLRHPRDRIFRAR